jgi:hypothetical protein
VKYLQTLESLNEGVDTQLADERKKQATIMEQINKLRKDTELKIDKESKPDMAKIAEKARVIQQCAKLTQQLASSMNTEASLMMQQSKLAGKGQEPGTPSASDSEGTG